MASSANVSGNGRFAGKILGARYGKTIVYDGMREKREDLEVGAVPAIVGAFPGRAWIMGEQPHCSRRDPPFYNLPHPTPLCSFGHPDPLFRIHSLS